MKKLISKRRVFCAAVVLAVIIVPLLYSYFYLGAFWDPYSKLQNLPVAVVNSDKGATINGTERNLGQEMCDRLKEDGSLKFVFTDAAEAKSGTEGDEYYATITIPENFSQNIASASTDNKQEATIIYSANEKRNFLASQILSRAVLEIEENTRASIVEQIVQELSNNIEEVPGQLTELSEGLGQLGDGSVKLLDGTGTLLDGTGALYDGTKTLYAGTGTLLDGTKALSDGTETLANGAQTLADGTKTFYGKFALYKDGVSSAKNGADELVTGAETLETGMSRLQTGADLLDEKTSGLSELASGAQSLAEGAKTFDNGLTQYTAGVDTLITTVNSTSTFLTQYVKANPSLMTDPTFAAFITKMSASNTAKSIQTLQAAGTQLEAASTQMVQGTEQLSVGAQVLPELKTALQSLSDGITLAADGSTALAKGANTLDTGIASISTAADQLYSVAGDIAGGAKDLNSGANDLNSGVNDLNAGAEDLNKGAGDLNDGAEDLNNGASDLKNGTEELNDGIITAKEGVDNAISDANDRISSLDGLADFAVSPVSVEQNNVATIPNYGTAFTPYFLSLSLWVGALILFIGIYLDTEGKFKIMSRESNHRVARSFLFLLVGFAQAFALALVVRFGLGLKVDNVPLYYASLCLVSMVFISIVQFFIVHLKSVGKLLSIVVLILQLTSCGGTFPMETVPKIFNVLYPYMPMTYSVALFKQAITSPEQSSVIYNAGILIAILVVFMALTIAISFIKEKKVTKTQVQMPVQFE